MGAQAAGRRECLREPQLGVHSGCALRGDPCLPSLTIGTTAPLHCLSCSWGHGDVSVPCMRPLCSASPCSKSSLPLPFSLRTSDAPAALGHPGPPWASQPLRHSVVTWCPLFLQAARASLLSCPRVPADTFSSLFLCRENSKCAHRPLGPEEMFTLKLELWGILIFSFSKERFSV